MSGDSPLGRSSCGVAADCPRSSPGVTVCSFSRSPCYLTLAGFVALAGYLVACLTMDNLQQTTLQGSHKGTSFKPLRWVVPGTTVDGHHQTMYSLCNCKLTRNPPFCDAYRRSSLGSVHIHLDRSFLPTPPKQQTPTSRSRSSRGRQSVRRIMKWWRNCVRAVDTLLLTHPTPRAIQRQL